MKRQLLHIIILLLYAVCLPLSLQAQHNIYKIDDSLFPYYQRAIKVAQQPQVMLIADTLFREAAKIGDQKAQCIALHLKVDYYYYNQDLLPMKDAIKTLKDFAVKTPFRQYVFSGWNRLVTYYLMKRQYDMALEEVKLYQAEATRLNNPYGIGFAFRHLGSTYKQMGSTDLAIKYNLQGAEYLEQYGNAGDSYAMYQSVGELYTLKNDFALSEKYLKKAMDVAPNNFRKMQPLLYLVSNYAVSGNLPEAKKCLDEARRIKEKNPVYGNWLNNFYGAEVKYSMMTGDYDRVLALVDSLPMNVRFEQRYLVNKIRGNYEEALRWHEKLDSMRTATNTSERNTLLAEYASRFDNNRLESEKNRLALLNSEMQVHRLADERRLMEVDNERARLQLQAARLELENSDLSLKQQKADLERSHVEIRHQKERLATAEESRHLQNVISLILVLLLALLVIFIFVYTLQRRKSIVRLRKEKNMALRARNEALAAREEAEEANRQKSIFLQNMSHEIRTPLNAIVGFSDVVNSPEDLGLTPEEKEDYLHLIHVNTELLTTLVNDVLDLSKLESGTYALALSNVSVGEVCRNVLASVSSRAVAGVELKLDEPASASAVTFLTDAVRLQQLLTNFLTNACKYTERGSITLGYRCLADGGMEFSVADTGSGIPADKAEAVFGRFEKLDTFKQGTGLGLSICRRIAELIGGRVYVDTAYTGGARFVFVHPLLTADSVAAGSTKKCQS